MSALLSVLPSVLPLLGYADSHAPLLHHNGKIVTRGDFVCLAVELAAQLPGTRYAINLCQDRFYFMLGFAAACLREQTNLLPASLASGALQAVAADYSEHHVMDDGSIAQLLKSITPFARAASDLIPNIATHALAAICFTSGSTGRPQPHANTWGTLVASAKRSAAGIFVQPGLNIVATVPPQHMFGLETSIFQPLVNHCSIHAGKPFFPADIFAALQSLPEPRALVTTPAHLRACVTALPTIPSLEFVLSATAPLTAALAAQTETAWQTKVLEIYGSTETGAIATRRTIEGDAWRLLPGGCLSQGESQPGDATQYQPDHATHAIALHDGLRLLDDTHFVLAGRRTDLIKIAGKRASLAELNARLLAIPGVKDGVIFQPIVDQRVAALVVTDTLAERAILAALAMHLDEVFLPRPLRIVAALPRDAVGKLPHTALMQALR